MRRVPFKRFAVCITLLGAVAIWIAPASAGELPGFDLGGDKITESLTFDMPACPIEAATVPPTKTEFTLPKRNPLHKAISIEGSIQVTDQTGATVILLQGAAEADRTGVTFARTVKTIAHATGSLDFDRGCTATDPFGSNNCAWTWGESITAAYQGALQEDITSGKLVANLEIDEMDKTIPFSFSCPVCGAKCTITIPHRLDDGRWDAIWRLMIRLIRLPFGLITPPTN